MAGKFFLYLGIFFACTGFATPLGIIMLVMYFWQDIKNTLNHPKKFDYNSYTGPKYAGAPYDEAIDKEAIRKALDNLANDRFQPGKKDFVTDENREKWT